MALDNYSVLKEEIQEYLDDSLSDRIDTFIDIAEARHQREVRIRDMLSREALTVDDRYVSLPTGYLEAKTLRLLTDPVTVLTYVNLHEMNRIRMGQGKPKFFTIHEQLEFDKDPDSSYSGEIVFYKSLDALSDSNTSNAILSRAPDVYLYAALAASAPFLVNDERVQVWESLYRDARDGLNGLDRKRPSPVAARPAGATP